MPAVALHHRVSGPGGAPPVLLGGSLGSTTSLWDELVADLEVDHRVVAFDLRGHGFSPTASGPLSMADLAADVAALASRLGLEEFHYVGLSLGGAIGQQLALDDPESLASLTLACTTARFGEPAEWRDRAAAVRRDGVGPLRMPTGNRWFTEEVETRRPDRVEEILDALVATDPESYAILCETLGGFDARADLHRIDVPTRVVSADQDPVCPPEATRLLAETIPNAVPVVIRGAAHLANVCRPDVFAATVRAHVAAHPVAVS